MRDSDAFRLIAVSRGRVGISIQGQKQVLKTKDMLLLFPGEECTLCDETGSVHYFSRFFKEKEKYSPLEYRMKRTKNRSYALELQAFKGRRPGPGAESC